MAKHMSTTRHCATCQKPTLTSVAREMRVAHSVYRYECEGCGESHDMVPLSGIGTGLAIGGLVLGFWGMILFRGAGSPSGWALGLYSVAALLLVAVWGAELLKHRAFPPALCSDDEHNVHQQVAGTWVNRLEKMGFLGGLLAPIVLIGGVLGIAALIGYINFTYFE